MDQRMTDAELNRRGALEALQALRLCIDAGGGRRLDERPARAGLPHRCERWLLARRGVLGRRGCVRRALDATWAVKSSRRRR